MGTLLQTERVWSYDELREYGEGPVPVIGSPPRQDPSGRDSRAEGPPPFVSFIQKTTPALGRYRALFGHLLRPEDRSARSERLQYPVFQTSSRSDTTFLSGKASLDTVGARTIPV